MQQLSGLDASFLYLETPNAPMHISSLAIYDQSTAPGGRVRFKDIIDNTANRIKKLPVLSRRLLTVPFGLDHPYWISDGSFDPEFHIRHIALPAPGDWRQLCIQIARLHARPLDRGRPLWEMYVIEGLDNVEGYPSGCFAIFTKMHHAAVDGASGMEVTAAVHDLSPKVDENAEPYPVEISYKPGSLELIVRSQLSNLRQPFRLISLARNTVPGFARAYARLRKGELRRIGEIPRTRFNGKVSAHRVFDAARFSLADVKAIKNAISGATVNDVAIALVGGALRHYLKAKDELPDNSLVAMAPINVRDSRETGTGGNIVSAMAVLVRSDIADPRERLEAVHQHALDSKELANAIGAKSMTDYTQFIPSTLTAQAARLASRWNLTNQINPIYNCVITNVPGPQLPLYNTGAKMLSNLGAGPVLDSVGLFHVISSYCGEFSVSVTSCRELLPDPDFYRQCIQDSFEELYEAMVGVGVKTPASGVVKKAKSRSRKPTPKKSAGGKAQKTRAPRKRAAVKGKSAAKRKAG
ncbi:MAG: wax ester/triacylglycerol synthase family O-acyltransferase [Pseudomonadota bacterium]